jgi:transaldolase
LDKNPLLALKARGQHIWLDHLSRTMLREETLRRLIDEDGVDGVVSNLAVFQKSLVGSSCYVEDLARLRDSGLDAEGCYEALMVADVQAACDILKPVYDATAGKAGFVSLDIPPNLAHDAAGIERAALRLCRTIGCANLLVKIPGSAAGLVAVENLTALGVGVNVTQIFSLAQYDRAVQAYLRGTRRWIETDGKIGQLHSVASVFLGRVDMLVDKRLTRIGTPLARVLRGRSGVALAKCCYQRYLELFHGPVFAALAEAGVQPQMPVWADVGGKNPAYSDVLYVEALIGPETISLLSDTVLAAFRGRGQALDLLVEGAAKARYHIMALAGQGIDLDAVGEELLTDGVRQSVEIYGKVLASL